MNKLKKIKNICKRCNSIVDVELKKIQSSNYEPIIELIKSKDYLILDLEFYLRELLGKTTNLFCGNSYIQMYNQTIRRIDELEDLREKLIGCLKYNYYYNCPVCKEVIPMEIENE